MASVPKTDFGFGTPQSIFEVSAKKHYGIGQRGYLDDGRVFRYGKLVDGTAIGRAKVAQQCPPVANHVSETGAFVGLDVAGSKRISVTLGATAAYLNEYENGYLKIESATTGAGQMWRIPHHAAVASAGVLTFDLPQGDAVDVATSGTETWSLIHSPWGSAVIQPTTVTAPVSGITCCDWPAATTTAPIYGWLQTWGIAPVLLDTSALVAGSGVITSGITAGACAVAVETDIKQRIGVAIEAIGTDNIYATVFLQIAA